ncbi:hypothetical protein Tsubulata_026626 [Turnera subulata]|uniref:Uncharacterized protein n=1 Tax=Turnera subulata TaxID=218843 RepID=A0A9Q0G727_9ROSI|nr:hypothetical protein Tsubulata_026626 [Turnera subulata]
MAISGKVTEASSSVLNTFSSTPTSTTTTATAALAVAVISIIIILKLQRRRGGAFKNLPLPPGAAPWPLIGNFPDILLRRSYFRWIHGFMKEMNTDIACIRVGYNTHIIPVTCPEIAQEIYKKNDAAFASRPLTQVTQLASGGYLATVFANNDQWKKMKKMLVSEVASPAKLKWLHGKRAEEADNLVFYVHNQYKANKSVVLRLVTRHYSANVIRRMSLGRRNFGNGMPDGGPGPEELEHVEAIFTTLKYIFSFNISDYLPSLLAGLDLYGQQKLIKHAISVIDNYHNPIIDERMRQWRSGDRKDMEDILDVLITLKDSSTGHPFLTVDEIRYQLVELFLAGLDNPSNAIEWTIGEMINQPELLKKAQEEIDSVVGKERLVQESDIRELNYVFRTRSLRKSEGFPSVREESAIPNPSLGFHTLLGEFKLGLAVYLRGDVSLLESDLKIISFSTGSRGCIGTMLGTYMTVMLLARLIQCFDWAATTSKGIDLSEPDDEPLCPATPVTAFAKPRLASHLYPTQN